ncbi:hypothetical protein J3A83DRAFT_4189891 [Scleroderma citrinum]
MFMNAKFLWVLVATSAFAVYAPLPSTVSTSVATGPPPSPTPTFAYSCIPECGNSYPKDCEKLAVCLQTHCPLKALQDAAKYLWQKCPNIRGLLVGLRVSNDPLRDPWFL